MVYLVDVRALTLLCSMLSWSIPFCSTRVSPKEEIQPSNPSILVRKDRLSHSIPLNMSLDTSSPPSPIIPKLVRDPLLERIIRLRFQKQRGNRLQNSRDPRSRLPLIRLQDAEAHVAERVVGDVGVVDGRHEA